MNQNTYSMLKKNYNSVLNQFFNKKITLKNPVFFKHFQKINLRKRFSKILSSKSLIKLSKKVDIKKLSSIQVKKRGLIFFKNLKKIKKINDFTLIKILSSENFIAQHRQLKLKSKYQVIQQKISNIYLQLLHFLKLQIKNFNKVEFIEILKGIVKRIAISCLIYFIPFCFLTNQTFFPQVIYKNELLILEGLSFQLLSRFDILKSMILNFGLITGEWATNQTILFLSIIVYLRVFAFSYDKFKIPLNVAYQGTTAFIYITLSYCFYLYNGLISTPFNYFLVLKAFFYRNFLENRFAIVEDWLDDAYFEITEELVESFSEKIYNLYENYLLFISKNITGVVTFITLCSLIYNIIYYVLKNKNPKVFFVSSAANSILKKREKNK